MRILFLTFGTLASSPGHLARFAFELPWLSRRCDVGVLCLGPEPDGEATRAAHPSVRFFHAPARFSGWSVDNLGEVLDAVSKSAAAFEADLVVLQMEVWDLIRELPGRLAGTCRFAAVCHAMPFLGAPVALRGFREDVSSLLASGIADYRQRYIEAHAGEADAVLCSTNIVANNRTVGSYLRHYFPAADVREMAPSAVVSVAPVPIAPREFDLAYMARMERGKGVDQLASLLESVAAKVGGRLRVAVMGRADDASTAAALDDLVDPRRHPSLEVRAFGWADAATKRAVLGASGAFVYPSRYDNYPTVVNEALAAGLPVVTWNTYFYRLNYASTLSVAAAPLDDAETFAALAARALGDRGGLSAEARDFIASLPDAAETADADIDLFREIIENGK